MAVKQIPDGYHSITPYLTVPGIAKLIDFMKSAFDAKETECMSGPDGAIMHAEVRIGDSTIMMGELRGDQKPTPASMYLYVTDTDTVYKRALQAGATSIMAPADQFYGDRNAGVKDLSGNSWWIATHKEDLTRDEIMRRAQAQNRT